MNPIAARRGGGQFGAPSFATRIGRSCSVRAMAMMPLIVLGACITRNWDNIVATVSLRARRLAVFRSADAAQRAAAARFAGQRARVLSVAVRDGLQPERQSADDAAASIICLRCACAASTRWRRRPITMPIGQPAIERWPSRSADGRRPRSHLRRFRSRLCSRIFTARPFAFTLRFARSRLCGRAVSAGSRDRRCLRHRLRRLSYRSDAASRRHISGRLQLREIAFAKRVSRRTRTHCPKDRAARTHVLIGEPTNGRSSQAIWMPTSV